MPHVSTTEVLVPLAFVVSGALIGRWWAPTPAVITVAALNLVEAMSSIQWSAAISIHGGDFSLKFLLLTSVVALVLSLTGVVIRVAASYLVNRMHAVSGDSTSAT